MRKHPPRLCRRIFKFFIPEYDRPYFFNGIDEVYQGLQQSCGKWFARIWYWAQLGKSLPMFVSNTVGGNMSMFKNYFKTGLRNIRRNKGYSVLNIMGLAVGLAVCILIFLWVQEELSYDRFHVNADRIFRMIEFEYLSNGEELAYSQQGPELAAVLKSDFPEIEESTRFDTMGNRLVRSGDRQFYENAFAFADPQFLTMFTFPLKEGDPNTALADPSSMIISERMAKKYFDRQDPMGKILRVDNQMDFVITGILENIPSNSHLQFDFLAQFESIKHFGQEVTGWGSYYLDTYVLLNENVDYRELDPKIKEIAAKYTEGSVLYEKLQPLSRIRLFSNAILTPQGEGDIKYVVIFSLIAIFILLNACINFMNLTTARSGQRAREISMRKVVGARRQELVRQFFGESILMAFISLIFAVGLVYLLLPGFNQLSGKAMTFGIFQHWHVILGLLGITLSAGLIAGIYPSLFLSSFQPAAVLKSGRDSGQRGGGFRRVLVIFQFVMTTILIVGTVGVYQQMNFLRSQNLGYDKDHVMCLRLPRDLEPKIDLIETTLERNPSVLSTAAASTVPGKRGALFTMENWEGRDSEDRIEMGLVNVDTGFLSTFKLEMAQGRFFSKDFPTDKEEAVVVNEAAVRAMGMENPIGKRIAGGEARIIGVVKDFNIRTLHHKVAPLTMVMNDLRLRHLFVKIVGTDIPRTISSVEATWRSLAPDYPFEFQFLDESLEELYQADRRLGNIINAFAGLALFVACLGLFGLASFVAERRTKEIGIRKVLGASIPVIFYLLARDFIKWIVIANVIAAPLAAYSMTKYLNIYAYHTSLGPVLFLIPAVMILVVALLTVSWQALRAAAADPVRSLRYE
jgi:ABC-type antimicrobial peptide transport system permease subunit